MIDFKYCLWFIPNANHEWNNIINEFGAHMTIKSKLEYNDAINAVLLESANHTADLGGKQSTKKFGDAVVTQINK